MKHTFRMSAILVSNQLKFYIAVLVSDLFPTGKLCILGQINPDLSHFSNIFYLMLLGIKFISSFISIWMVTVWPG